MNVIFNVTMLGEYNFKHVEIILSMVRRSFAWAKYIPGPGDLLALEPDHNGPPIVYHVNRKILRQDAENVVWELVVENGADGLLVGKEYLQGVIEGLVRSSSKKVLNEQQQVALITDTIYEATRGRVIYG